MKNVLDMNLIEIQDILSFYSKDSNNDVRRFAKNSLAIINEESFDIKSTLTSNTAKSIRSRAPKPKK